MRWAPSRVIFYMSEFDGINKYKRKTIEYSCLPFLNKTLVLYDNNNKTFCKQQSINNPTNILLTLDIILNANYHEKFARRMYYHDKMKHRARYGSIYIVLEVDKYHSFVYLPIVEGSQLTESKSKNIKIVGETGNYFSAIWYNSIMKSLSLPYRVMYQNRILELADANMYSSRLSVNVIKRQRISLLKELR